MGGGTKTGDNTGTSDKGTNGTKTGDNTGTRSDGVNITKTNESHGEGGGKATDDTSGFPEMDDDDDEE